MLAADLLTGAREAADFTGLPVRTIYQMVDLGKLPAIKKGKRLYFRKSELEAAFSSERAA